MEGQITKPSSNIICLEEEIKGKRVQGYEEEGSKARNRKAKMGNLIKKIEERLSVLEEEDQVLKEGVIRSMEETRFFIHDIFQQFQSIHKWREHNYFDQLLLSSTHALKEEKRAGILQVLWEDSNPTLITRYGKAQALAVIPCPPKYADNQFA